MSFYKFECRCVACLNDWPVFEGLRKTVAKPGMAEKVPDVKKMYAVLVKLSQQDLQVRSLERDSELFKYHIWEDPSLLNANLEPKK